MGHRQFIVNSPPVFDKYKYKYLSNPALTPLEETISTRKNAEKYAISTLIFEKFPGGIAPDPHAGERLRRPSPYTPPPSALRRFPPPRLARDFRSLHRRPPPKKKYLTCFAHPKIWEWRPYAIYGCPENFRNSLTTGTPTAILFPQFYGLLFRWYRAKERFW